MNTWMSLLIAAGLLAGTLGAAVAHDYSGASSGNLNSTNSLAGKSYKGAPGGAKTSPIGSGPTDCADSGVWNTTNSLAGIETHGDSAYVR